MSADLYFTSVSSFLFFLSSFFSPPNLRGRWTELNKIGDMVGSKCNLKMHVRNLGYPFPVQIGRGPKNHPFSWLYNLTATSTAYIFGMRRDIHKQASALQTPQRVSYIMSKRYELWSTNGFKLEVRFYPPSVNCAFHFIARLRRRRSANGTQPHFVKRWMVDRANNLS